MAYQTIKTTTRNVTDIPFFVYNEQINNYVNETYAITGKRISNNITLSEDGLQQIVTSVWVNEAAYDEFKNDRWVSMTGTAVVAYNAEHNITETWTNLEVL